VSVEFFALGLVSFLLLASNVFWARHCLMLTNRIMSRNYFDVAQADSVKRRQQPKVSDEPEMIYDPEDVRQAVQLNSVFANI
jgi:hypothetical protein